MKFTLLIWYLLLHLRTGNTENLHVPWNLAWTLTNPETRQALRVATEFHPLATWYPQLTFNLCALAKDSWENTVQTLQNSYPACKHCDWYICLGCKPICQCVCVWGGGLKYFIVLPGDVKPVPPNGGLAKET